MLALADRGGSAGGPLPVTVGDSGGDVGAVDAAAVDGLAGVVAATDLHGVDPQQLLSSRQVWQDVAHALMNINKQLPLYKGIKEGDEVGRYHSWIVSREAFPSELEITATDDNGYIMGLQHKTYDVQGVQFHPESVLTPCGERILKNWIEERR